MNSAELYGKLPAPSGTPPTALPSRVKVPNPWATIYKYAPEMTAPVPGSKQSYVAGDNLTNLTEQLKQEFPDAKTPAQQFTAAVNMYGVPGNYQFMRKNKQPVSTYTPQGERPMALSPYIPETGWDTTFFPTAEQMKDPKTQLNSGPDRSFGALAHEVRHIIQNKNGKEFIPEKNQQKKDSWGNQMDHLPGTFIDRDETNAMDLLNLSRSNPIPDYVRVGNPWMGPKGHQPTLDDLMHYIGSQPGYKK